MSSPKERYAQYLKTEYWHAVTLAVKARAGYRCQICNSPHDLEPHHRTYEHRGRELEFLDDLICMCRRCHGVFHGVAPTVKKLKPPEPTVEITEENHRRLKSTHDAWHWMLREGINPKKKGWARRAIGHRAPISFLKSP